MHWDGTQGSHCKLCECPFFHVVWSRILFYIHWFHLSSSNFLIVFLWAFVRIPIVKLISVIGDTSSCLIHPGWKKNTYNCYVLSLSLIREILLMLSKLCEGSVLLFTYSPVFLTRFMGFWSLWEYNTFRFLRCICGVKQDYVYGEGGPSNCLLGKLFNKIE